MEVGVPLWRVNKSEGSEGISHTTEVQIYTFVELFCSSKNKIYPQLLLHSKKTGKQNKAP